MIEVRRAETDADLEAWRGVRLDVLPNEPALKRRQLCWAAAHGIREIVTWTQRGNENMRRVNERLGYLTTDLSLTLVARLPL